MANEKATSVLASGGVTKDDLMVVYGEVASTVTSRFIYRSFLNTNYTDTPVKGGTVKVKRMKSSISDDYGTARAAGEGRALQNNGVDVKINVSKEISEEMSIKDVKLYMERGGAEYLRSRQADYSLEIGNTLEYAYFTRLEQLAQANSLVDVTAGDSVSTRLETLIQALEATTNDNVKTVDRSDMILTLRPAIYDKLEGELVKLESLISGRTDARFFRRVEVVPAVRQGYDAIVQFRGAVAQPVVFDSFKVEEPNFSNDLYSFMSYHFGTEGVMPELVLGADVDEDGAISA